MNIEYKKDMRNNYMILEKEDHLKQEAFCIKMLEEQRIDGILSLKQRFMDNKTLFYYDITGKQSMSSILEKAALSYDKLKSLLAAILSVLEKAYEYLLSEDDFILTPDFIYLEVISFAPELCYLSGYKKDIKNQLSTLLEYLMNKVDYNDKAAVLMVYKLYAVSKEQGFTPWMLSEIITNQKKEEVLQKRELLQKEKPQHIIEEPKNIERFLIREQSQNNELQQSRELPRSGELSLCREPAQGRELIQGKEQLIRKKISQYRELSHRFELPQGKEIFRKPRLRENKSIQQLENIPIMMERVEEEQEVLIYPLTTYLLTGICGLMGVVIFILTFTCKIVYNSFGNRVEYDKLLAIVLIIGCIEGYIMKKLWDKKNKVVKIVTRKKYVDPRDYERESNSYSNKMKNIMAEERKSDMIWSARQEANLGVKEQELPRHNASEIDEDNPTCMLNLAEVSPSSGEIVLLHSVDEDQYPSITVKEFPFFIGKLRKNVDYCLEKDVISRFHAKLTREGDTFYLTDLNSKNGTFINQEALQIYEPKEIRFGDEIAFANIKYRLEKLSAADDSKLIHYHLDKDVNQA
jgi:hypothetical protein